MLSMLRRCLDYWRLRRRRRRRRRALLLLTEVNEIIVVHLLNKFFAATRFRRDVVVVPLLLRDGTIILLHASLHFAVGFCESGFYSNIMQEFV